MKRIWNASIKLKHHVDFWFYIVFEDQVQALTTSPFGNHDAKTKGLHAIKSHICDSTPSSYVHCLTDAGQWSKFNLGLLPVPSCLFCAANLNRHILKVFVLMKG